ncbi:MAG: BirA family transcriptional regulator, biotin operon repressor [Candidatus Electronema aureum]|uniref:BirA family transcriptional regulator, biotin operon repressor n=1 Tax=Candidatus Electronema aureum TaxID=2005002 RepID=A0A521G2I0_9BACT|nr:MAG: BirA family transcriptional regulator, biotin operon repressor [Candidatus Electronema aureum]
MQLHHFAVVDSTSSIALDLARQGAAQGTVVHADQQTGGRGQNGRQFCSPPGGLYFSVILRPELELVDFPLLTLAAGVGLCRGLMAAVSVQPLLKWPNDLYFADKKLGGILTESGPLRAGLPEFVVVGVGINVAALSQGFPPELRGRIIALAETGAAAANPAALLPGLVEDLLAATERLKEDKADLLAEWRQRDYLLNRPLEYCSQDKVIPAVGAGLAEDGRYVIIDRCGREQRVMAGDVSPIRAEDINTTLN